MSSGQFVTEQTEWVDCMASTVGEDGVERECGFAGEVDAAFDPEVGQVFWTCPKCGTEHLASLYEWIDAMEGDR